MKALVAIVLTISIVVIALAIGLSVKRGPVLQQPVSTPPLKTIEATPSATSILTPTPTPELFVPPIIPGERGEKIPILLYHYISENLNKDDKLRTGLSTPPAIFEKQLETLESNGFTSITFDELAASFTGKFFLPARPVILTFDDGYADFYTNAYPLLKKYRMKGVAFIPTGLIGGSNYMNWPQIEELSRSSFVIFGAHSVHHYALTRVTAQVLQTEAEESKRILEQHVGSAVNWFAYPYGAFNEAVVAAVQNAGFVGAVTTLSGSWQYQSHLYYTPRYRAGRRVGKDLLKIL